MADEYTNVQLVMRHVPSDKAGPFKSMQEAQAAGHDTLNPVTGTVQFGILDEGAFVPLIEDQAGRYFHVKNAAQAAQQANSPQDAAQQ